MSKLSRAWNIDDLGAMARARLPKGLYDFIERGAEDEVTLRENAESIKRVLIRPRTGVDVSQRDISTTLFGVKQSMPVGIAATGLAALLSYDGETSLARAAAGAGVPYMIGSSNFTCQADLNAVCGDLLWRQIYPPKRRELLDHHIATAKEAGVRVLVVTLDLPVPANREYMNRNGFSPGALGPKALAQVLAAPRWVLDTLIPYYLRGGLPKFADMPNGERRFLGGTFSWAAMADDFCWDDVKALRQRWQDVLVLKGLSTAEDARIASECGVDGIIVSNHGGRGLDGCVPSFAALPEIVDAVAPKVTVMVDGGFRRGADVLKAIAIGASAVFVGRATLYGLAAGGQAGVARALAILREEISRAMALSGCRDLSELGRESVNIQALAGSGEGDWSALSGVRRQSVRDR
jgi:isopentenyl diphosphate isomerase/L-lactate dehydrogenase-like FMN-dependent dehydrogenase